MCECDAIVHIIDSRKMEFYTKRRKECVGCKRRFTTFEFEEGTPPYRINYLLANFRKRGKRLSKSNAQKQTIKWFIAELTRIRNEYKNE